MKFKTLWIIALLTGLGLLDARAEVSWQTKLERDLPLLGHRNWIVIADAAYPWQTAKGIETVDTGAEQLAVVEAVLKTLAKAKHVKPTIYVDKEMDFVAEKDAPGITDYRVKLKTLLGDRPVKVELHEDIIKKLDEAGKTFHVLLLKTKHVQPYTSVFLQLECGYWDAASEKRLRDTMQSVK
jgi:L-fucose mutarotase/ribose pyranase (RbsD/FucU family)